MKEILFICQGNVGRSQMAEGFYNHFRGKQQAISAGIDDVGQKYDFRPRADIIQVMSEKGVDISDHRIKQVTPEIAAQAEKIVVLCQQELLPDYLLVEAHKLLLRQIPDPFESGMDEVRNIRDSIEAVVLGLLNESDKETNE